MKRKCPICRKLENGKFRPFCSKRCADLDLGNWIKDVYRIPIDEDSASFLSAPKPEWGKGDL